MERYYYRAKISDFVAEDTNSILGKLSNAESFDTVRDQKNAWVEEIGLLKHILPKYDGDIIFEYSVPRLGKRIDVVLLINGIVLCLEFKAGADRFESQDKEQVWDYALDLKNFHEPCRDLYVVPVLVATDAPDERINIETCNYDSKVLVPIKANGATLENALVLILENLPQTIIDTDAWPNGRYSPTPTIIQAASALYNNHRVEDITRNDAGENLTKTTDYVLNVVAHAKANHEKSICFVTGVPGAGKTLVGLNVAMKLYEQEAAEREIKEGEAPAVYLSGNGPLVDVLSEALARDKVRQDKSLGKKSLLSDARRAVKSFIQIIHHYRDDTLQKVKMPIVGDNLELKAGMKPGVEHVAIFDEAQRLWDKPHLSAWLARKKGVAGFPMSESEFLIWSMDLHQDWAVVVCLVGGGQEINSGEAGIAEPIRAINERFKNWNVFIPPQLTAKEYAEGKLDELVAENVRVSKDTSLHLATSMRSFRAENLSSFVHQLLDLNPTAAQRTYKEFCDKYPIVITRDLNKAKDWLRKMAGGSERYGMICSSQAFRLRPLAIDVRAKPDTVHWFLDDITDVRSSLFLEDVATEFDIQGLELDYTALVWDGDFRFAGDKWTHHDFSGDKWKNIKSTERRAYQLNAYRVLLTRARKGMVICVPAGNASKDHDGALIDPSRNPAFYDSTYEYLKSLGLRELI